MATLPPEPSPNREQVIYDSSNTILIVDDGPGDTTIRPSDPNIPKDWPPRRRTQTPPAGGDTGTAPPPAPENA